MKKKERKKERKLGRQRRQYCTMVSSIGLRGALMTTFCCSFKSFKAWLSSLYMCTDLAFLLLFILISFHAYFQFPPPPPPPPLFGFLVIACGKDFCYSSLHFPKKRFSICISSICFLVNVTGNVNYSHIF